MMLKHLTNKAIAELKTKGILTAEIDTRAILKYVSEQDDVYLLTHNTELVTNAQYQKFRRLIRRRKAGEPVAYLTGHKEFYGLDFIVNKNVLIPRPETEVLVDESLEILKKSNDESMKQCNILDIGTGTGCIIISICNSLVADSPKPKAYAVDISAKALNIAKQNARHHNIYDNIQFLKSDLFSNSRLPQKFDLIIANLPYLTKNKAGIAYADPGQIGLKYEPSSSLYAEDDGFELIEKLVRELPKRLSDGGVTLLETDETHGKRLMALAKKLSLSCQPVKNQTTYKGFFEITKS